MPSALLIIDVQQILCSGKNIAHDVDGVINRINLVSRKARAAGTLVVVIQHETKDGDMDYGTEAGAYLVRRRARRPSERPARSPIVMATIIDPVASGLVTSLAQPGGNLSGQSMMSPDLVGKQLEILKEVVFKVSRVALLHNPANPGHAPQVRHAQDAARALGVRLQPVGARGPSEIDSAFAAMANEQAGAVIVVVDAIFQENRTRITDLAARHRLPAVYGLSEYAKAGGLLAYGPNRLDMFRHAVTYVDKILKGAKPAGLPVEQPTKFELVINLRTAKALGLTIPPSLLQRADQVIE